jgi:hypothetical protein
VNGDITLPPHLEPARDFYDIVARMLAQAVVRDLSERESLKRRPRPLVKRDILAEVAK